MNSGKSCSGEVALDDKVYELREERGQVTAHVGHSVGGVVLSHERTAEFLSYGTAIRSTQAPDQPPSPMITLSISD